MSEIKQSSKFFPKDKWSVVKKDKDGHKKMVNEHPFIMFDTGGRASLYYHQKFNAYYTKPGTEPITDKAKLDEIYTNVRWTFSKVDEKGIETFPATPKNIADKRSEVAAEWSASGKEFSAVDVMLYVSPTDYIPQKGYVDAIEQAGGDQQLKAFRRSMGLA